MNPPASSRLRPRPAWPEVLARVDQRLATLEEHLAELPPGGVPSPAAVTLRDACAWAHTTESLLVAARPVAPPEMRAVPLPRLLARLRRFQRTCRARLEAAARPPRR